MRKMKPAAAVSFGLLILFLAAAPNLVSARERTSLIRDSGIACIAISAAAGFGMSRSKPECGAAATDFC